MIHTDKKMKKKAERKVFPPVFETAAILYAGFTTAPERIHRVQALTRTVRPVPVTVRTFCRFGSQRRRVLLWAWLTLFPVSGPFPQISHTRAIIYISLQRFFLQTFFLTTSNRKCKKFPVRPLAAIPLPQLPFRPDSCFQGKKLLVKILRITININQVGPGRGKPFQHRGKRKTAG
jgi:hypothetical protein